jgi:dihydrodipicolinate synthase/N-acetylneuraminate lyase
MGLPAGGHRLPLTPLSDEKTNKLRGFMQKSGVL